MTGAQVIVLAMPVFLLAIALEFAVGRARGRNTYRLNDTLGSLGLGVMSQVFDAFGTLFKVAMYTWVFQHVALFELSPSSLWVWIGALLGYDFCYYWLHRAGHRVGVLWAAHVVHHQSEDYNLGTALRQTSSGFLLGWIFYLPMAVAGVPPLVFGVVALIDLLYQFWVHTQQVGKLGWFDRWFCSPSNHRAHHAVNERYLDKNYGGILIVWDRLFGTFVEEDDRRPGGLRHARAAAQLQPAVGQPAGLPRPVAGQLARALVGRQAARLARSRRAGGRPTWPRAGRSRPSTSPPCSASTRRCRRAPRGWPCVLFVAVLAGLGLFLWHVHRLSLAEQLAGSVALVAALWAIGALTQPRGAADAARRHGGARPMSAPALRAAGHRLHLRQQGRPGPALHRGARRDADRGRRRVRLGGRPHRLRQEHAAQRRPPGCWRPAAARCRCSASRWQGINTPRRLHVPDREPDALAHRAGQRDGRAGVPRRARRRGAARRPRTGCERVGLGGFGDRYPHQLSGGMRKRTAWRRRWRWTPTSS